VFLANETQFAHFDITSEFILIPNKTFDKIAKNLTSVAGVICNQTNITGCIYKDLCSNIVAKMPHLDIQFSDKTVYEIPP
jgi:hypothetical protein